MVHLNSSEIDKVRWNEVIDQYGSGLPYAYSWILDELTGHCWDAIIDENYEWILPLPYNRKIAGLKQYYTPYCLQQLGLIGKQPEQITWQQIEQLINKNCIRARLALNEMNKFYPKDKIINKPNFVLPLSSTYHEIHANFKKNLQQLLKKKEQLNVRIHSSDDLTTFLKYYFQFTFNKYSAKEKISPEYIQSCYRTFRQHEMVKIMIAHNENGETVAGILYLRTRQRLIISLQFINPDFKHLSGPTLLIDELIRQNSGQPLELDFEGSAIPSIASFYRAFGPEERSFGVMGVR